MFSRGLGDRLDPAIGLVVVVVILGGTWGLLGDSVNLAMDAVPEGVDPAAVRAYLATLPGVVEGSRCAGPSPTTSSLKIQPGVIGTL